MSIINKEGIFKALVSEAAIGESKNKAILTCKYNIIQELQGEWVNCEHENWIIIGYHYLEKNDGSINESTIKSFKEAFEWDGKDITTLESKAIGMTVQITLKLDTYEGKSKIQVAWLNNVNYQPGIKPSNPDTVKSIQTRLGSKLRALSGGTPVPTPARPSTPPKTPPVVTETTEQLQQKAWTAYLTECASRNFVNEQFNNENWGRIVSKLTGKDEYTQCTAEDWRKFIIGFKVEMSDIPF